ncbi:DUF721 domain-containing protein [Candidatus Bipolaricaulota bacterium]|nr:DUF721 domain-containing protein [Candidatus Bipolaricaulota bacterium]
MSFMTDTGAHSEKKLGDVVQRYLAKSGLVRQLGTSSLQKEWEQTVGAEVARHTRVTSLRGGVLRVEVDSAPWLHELKGFYGDTIMQDLKERLKGRTLKKIEFRIGRF